MSRGRRIAVVLLLTVVAWLLLDDGGPVHPQPSADPLAAASLASVSDAATISAEPDRGPAVSAQAVPLPQDRSHVANRSARAGASNGSSSPRWTDLEPVVRHETPASFPDETSRTDSARRILSGRSRIRFTGTIESLH